MEKRQPKVTAGEEAGGVYTQQADRGCKRDPIHTDPVRHLNPLGEK
jgi:hypothetical protein